MEICEMIKMLREQQGLSQEALAEKVGYKDRSSIAKIEAGIVDLAQSKIKAFADALGVSPAYLMGYDLPEQAFNDLYNAAKDAVYVQEFNSLPEEQKIRALDSVRALPDNTSPIPRSVSKHRLGTIACGQPILAVEEADEFDNVPEWVECDFTLKCSGDSMVNARIFDGDIVYIRRQPRVENGEIAAVRIGDEATLKKVYYAPGDGRVTLRACNPLYKDLVYEGDCLSQIEVLGLAVGFYSVVRHD